MMLRFWLLVLDLVHALGCRQRSRVYLWVLRRAADACYRSER